MTKLLGAPVLNGLREEGESIVDAQQGLGDGTKTNSIEL